jgi:carboxymethylenebutenolidase
MTRTYCCRLAGACALAASIVSARTAAAQGVQLVSWPADYVARMAHEHGHEHPAASTPSLLLARSDVTGEEVTYGNAPDGTPYRGYLAHPDNATKGAPAVVAIHEWWGLNDHIRAFAQRLAADGYTVLAVDLYGGKTTDNADSAKAIMQTVIANPDAALANLKAANGYLRGTQHARKVGTIGWCFGGGWSIRDALLDASHVDADVAFYGPPDLDRSDLMKLRAPFLGLYGTADEGVPIAQVRQFQAKLDTLGKRTTFSIYEGAKHGFANESGPNYNQAAAGDAWKRTMEFFAKYLKH